MKSALLSAALAGAANAAAPPVITLEFEGMASAVKHDPYHAIYTNIEHDRDYKAPEGHAIVGRHDWTEECAANITQPYPAGGCPFPDAKAYDSQDGVLTPDVETRVYLIDKEGDEKTP